MYNQILSVFPDINSLPPSSQNNARSIVRSDMDKVLKAIGRYNSNKNSYWGQVVEDMTSYYPDSSRYTSSIPKGDGENREIESILESINNDKHIF